MLTEPLTSLGVRTFPTDPRTCALVLPGRSTDEPSPLLKKKKKKNESAMCLEFVCDSRRRRGGSTSRIQILISQGDEPRPGDFWRGAVCETRRRRWSRRARASDVAINQGEVSDVVCHIWSSVIDPDHRRAGVGSARGSIRQSRFIRKVVGADSGVHLRLSRR